MTALYPIGLKYLNNQQPINNGGITGLILNNIHFSSDAIDISKISNVEFWTTYAQQFLFNSTRLQPTVQNKTYQFNNQTTVDNVNRPYSIMMIFWLITFIVLILAASISSIVQCVKDKEDQKELNQFKFKKSRTKRNVLCRKRSRRIIILFSMTFILLLWVAFISMLCVSQYLVSSKFSHNVAINSDNGAQSYDSVNDAIALTFNYLNNFFNIINNQTGSFLGSSISTLSVNIKSQMNSSIEAFGSQVLITFNITDLFNTARMLINSLNQVVISMTYINNNCQTTLGKIDNIKGTVDVYRSNLDQYLNNICTKLSNYPSLQSTCKTLQLKNTQFQTNIQTGSVSSSSSIIMIFILQQYNINITAITTAFYVVDTNFKAQLTQLFNKTLNSIDIPSYLSTVSQMWSSIVNMTKPSFTTVNSYSSSFSSAFDTVSKYENLIIIILIFLIFIVILLVLFFSFRDSIHDSSLNRCINFFVQFLFLFLLTISAILSITLIIVANFSQSEICNQITTTSGIDLLDQILNDKLSTPWAFLAKSVSDSNPEMSINLVQPTNILSGIKDRCRNTNLGLLTVLGMGNFINITQIIRSKSVMQLVLNAKNDSLKAFYDVNPEQIIPSNLTAFFAQTGSIVAYFDGLDYSVGISELQKPLVGIVDFQGYFSQLSTFAINSSNSLGWTSDLIYLNDTINQLKKLSPNFAKTQNDVNILTVHFQALQNNRNNSFLMSKLLTIIENVKSLFANPVLITSLFSAQYDKDIILNLMNIVDQLTTTGINTMTYSMIPCGDLSKAFEALTTTFCSNTNFIVTIATFGILLLIETVICQMISIIVIVSISLRLSAEKNVSRC